MRIFLFLLICNFAQAQGYFFQGGLGARVQNGTSFVTDLSGGMTMKNMIFASQISLLDTGDVDIETHVGFTVDRLCVMGVVGMNHQGNMYFGGRLQAMPHIVQIGKKSYLVASLYIASSVITPNEDFRGFIHSFGVNMGFKFNQDEND